MQNSMFNSIILLVVYFSNKLKSLCREKYLYHYDVIPCVKNKTLGISTN